MGYRLYREVRDGAPADWTLAERLVALMIADDAGDDTRRSWIPLSGRWRKGQWVDGLTERTGLTADAVSKALQRLRRRGCEFRVPIKIGKDGRPVFACKSNSMTFRVPVIVPRLVPQSPDDDPPFSTLGADDDPPSDDHRADQDLPYKADRPDFCPPSDLQRPDRNTAKAGPPSGPSPHISSEPPPSQSPDDDPPFTAGGIQEEGARLKQDQARLDALVAEIRLIRSDWSTGSISSVLTRPSVAERPWPLVRSAALAVARDPNSQQPGRLAYDGPWWHQEGGKRASPPPLPSKDRHPFQAGEQGTCKRCELPASNRRHLEAS